MYFLEPSRLLYSSLSDQKTVVLSTEKETIFLHAVNVCNMSDDNIRISLQMTSIINTPIEESYLVKDVLLQPNESHNLMSLGNLEVFLKNGDSLICFSNGYSQVFDCVVCYSISNEEICTKAQ
tara:strand:- start:4406 stop:4774 length:369 start_codon:yes stop_codon:yes gene_type:complete